MEGRRQWMAKGADLQVGVTRFDGCLPIAGTFRSVGFHPAEALSLTLDGHAWTVSVQAVDGPPSRPDAIDLDIRFLLARGRAAGVQAAVRLVFRDWSEGHFVLMPAGAYDGNRFETRKMPYPPIFRDPDDLRPDLPVVITDIPRLSPGSGPSRIQLMTRDLSTPAIGFRHGQRDRGFWLLADPATRAGDSGLEIEESPDRSQAVLSVTAPGIRYPTRYTICDMGHPCDDRGVDLEEGESIAIQLRIIRFDCPSLPDLFQVFSAIRKDLSPPALRRPSIPLSAAWSLLEDKYNRDNWVEAKGYYGVGVDENWQVGWVGGLMATLPLLAAGSPLSVHRAGRNLDFAFGEGQSASGFFHGCADPHRVFGDHFDDPGKPWHLVRKSADALCFLARHLLYLRKARPQEPLPDRWLQGTRRVADAFVRLWETRGQFGQFVNTDTGDLLVGGSASAAIAPAGLALAARVLGDPRYLAVASAAADAYDAHYTLRGLTTGGPGEILQCPDSESAFGLLESFVTLYEETREARWLEKACRQADLCATWCVSYDYRFPPDSTFGRLDMRTTGTVYASVQNKHSAPGICTLSGDSLLRLYRATGESRFLELLRDIAASLPQYLSREDRPIGSPDGRAMPPGWMNERVEMSDWLEPIGEIFHGSCWCEVSLMLTFLDLPGLHVLLDTDQVTVFDQVDVRVASTDPDRLVLEVANPTPFDARVRVLAETRAGMAMPLDRLACLDWPVADIPAGAVRLLSVSRTTGGIDPA